MMKLTRVISTVLIAVLLFSTLALVPKPSMAQQQLPDLVVPDAWRADSQIWYHLKNIGQGTIGGGAAPPSYYSVLFIDGQQVAEDQVNVSLAPGPQLTRCFDYQWQATPGQHTLRVCADWGQNISESNEGNNCWEDVWVIEEGLPDLVVVDIRQEDNSIRYKIKNVGEASVVNPLGGTTPFCNALFIDGELVAKDYVNLHEMLPGQWIDNPFDYYWQMTAPQHTIKVCADWEQNVDEANEGNNCSEETWYMEEKLPDLMIDEIKCDRQNNRIGYVLKNIGKGTAGGEHSTTLFVDEKEVTHDLVSVDLKSGETHESWFKEYKWPECNTIEVKICADNYSEAEESNEQNNCLEKTCECIADFTLPQIISGPSVSQVSQTSAVIFWETDEASNSLVKYDYRSEKYGSVIEDSNLVKEHCLNLTNLEPTTTYHFMVESRDYSGNRAISRDLSFETLSPPDKEKPSLSLLIPDKLSGRVLICATTQDNIGVDRVVFFCDGEPVFTDFSAPFEWECDTRVLDEGFHDFGTQSFDGARNMAETHCDSPVQNFFPPDDSPVWVTIENPASWSEVYGWVDIRATISHEHYRYIGYAEITIISSETSEEVVYEPVYDHPWRGPGTPPSNTPLPISYAWDTSELEPGRYLIEVMGGDEFGNEGDATVVVSLVEPPPVELPLEINRDVRREGNYFQVELTVRNTGSDAVYDFTVTDISKGFQGVHDPDVIITYDRNTRQTSAKKNMGTLRPGRTCTLSYDLVPVLFHPSLPEYSYWIGESQLDVSYKDEFEREYSREYFAPYWAGQRREINNAFSSADYLIVTNPHHLFDDPLNAVGEVNQLLSRMSDLAKEKQGVLGYLPSGASAETLDRLIDARGSGRDRWFEKLCDDWLYNGYLLIVGEEEIVPSFTEEFHDVGPRKTTVTVPLSDNPYADSCSADEGKPELRVGRIIGNTAFELAIPIRISLDVSRGALHLDRSDALVVISHDKPGEYFMGWAAPLTHGLPGCYSMVTHVNWEYQDTEKNLLREALAILGTRWNRDSLPSELNGLRDLVGRWDLDDETALPEPPDDLTTLRGLISVDEAERVEAEKRGGPVRHYVLHPDSAQMLLARAHLVRDHAYDKDLICYVGHGGSGSWVWGLDEPHLSFISFGPTAPVVFASACETGDYETGWDPDEGIAEAFLSRGAAAYIGAVISVGGGSADELQRQFCLNEWTASRSIGEAFTLVKRNLMAIDNPDDPEWLRMAYVWNLYGDPKYGQ